jgi:molybdopterin-containing oxidoreductase family iron-sulfur binding subunit
MKPDTTDTPDALPPALLGTGRDEFPEGAAEFADEPSRRRFLTLMSASIALATGAGCNLRPAAQRKIMPYTTQPDEVTPGVPTFYASAAPLAGYGQGVLVRSSEGRPTKIEGNPSHPGSLGGAGLHALASVLDLYDPDRSRGVIHRGTPTSWELAVAALRKALVEDSGQPKNIKLRVVTEAVTSPTLAKQITDLLAAVPNARWVQFDAISSANAREGIAKAFGKPLNVVYDFNRADVVVSLDADFLGTGPGHVRYSRDFADRRKLRAGGKDAAEIAAGREAATPEKPFKEGIKSEQADKLLNRLYAVETMPTNTGAVAEHRLAITSGEIETFARALATAVGVTGVPPGGALSKAAQDWVAPLAADLKDPARNGKVIVVVGDHLAPSLHALAFAINDKLGALGKTVKLVEPVEATAPGKMMDLKALTGELAAKTADALLILGGANPAHTAPADVDFAAALAAFGKDPAKFSLHLGSHVDETGVLCDWHVNEAHYLETWGDVRGYDGTATIQQPLIAPLHGGKSAIELLATLMKPAESGVPAAPRDPMEIVRDTWKAEFHKKNPQPPEKKDGAFERFWQTAVRAGVVAGSASPPVAAGLATTWATGAAASPPPPSANDLEINFRACPALFDGRFANNGWLQELPKPLTKISWDNAAYLSPKTASELKLPKIDFRWTAGEHGRAEVSVLEIDVNGKKVKAPAWVLPGHADGAVTVHLGHGRTRAGTYAAHTPDEPNTEGQPYRGFNAYPLRTSAAPWSAPAKVTKTGKTYFLACTQGHWAMAEKDPVSGKMLDRKPVRRGSVAEYKKNPKFAKIPPMATGETEGINDNMPHPKGYKDHHAHDQRLHPLNMYQPAEGLAPGMREFQQRRWGMAFDLSACTGCSACVIACQSENNVPVVGKKEVTRGREMYWINIDRYYTGNESDANAVQAYFQPRMCVQCENAPCEIVCPVGATVHSTDGLNDMTYNRCVGTRYCSNNCPYKVRRFNFLTFQDWSTDTIKLGRNPDVSVRSRGVMEKCTFCVQRIRGAEIVAERELARWTGLTDAERAAMKDALPPGFRKEPDPAKGEVLIQDGEIVTACQAACPSGAVVFGDLNDPTAAVSRWKNEPSNYGLLAELNTRPRLTYTAVVRNPNPNMK